MSSRIDALTDQWMGIIIEENGISFAETELPPYEDDNADHSFHPTHPYHRECDWNAKRIAESFISGEEEAFRAVLLAFRKIMDRYIFVHPWLLITLIARTCEKTGYLSEVLEMFLEVFGGREYAHHAGLIARALIGGTPMEDRFVPYMQDDGIFPDMVHESTWKYLIDLFVRSGAVDNHLLNGGLTAEPGSVARVLAGDVRTVRGEPASLSLRPPSVSVFALSLIARQEGAGCSSFEMRVLGTVASGNVDHQTPERGGFPVTLLQQVQLYGRYKFSFSITRNLLALGADINTGHSDPFMLGGPLMMERFATLGGDIRKPLSTGHTPVESVLQEAAAIGAGVPPEDYRVRRCAARLEYLLARAPGPHPPHNVQNPTLLEAIRHPWNY